MQYNSRSPRRRSGGERLVRLSVCEVAHALRSYPCAGRRRSGRDRICRPAGQVAGANARPRRLPISSTRRILSIPPVGRLPIRRSSADCRSSNIIGHFCRSKSIFRAKCRPSVTKVAWDPVRPGRPPTRREAITPKHSNVGISSSRPTCRAPTTSITWPADKVATMARVSTTPSKYLDEVRYRSLTIPTVTHACRRRRRSLLRGPMISVCTD